VREDAEDFLTTGVWKISCWTGNVLTSVLRRGLNVDPLLQKFKNVGKAAVFAYWPGGRLVQGKKQEYGQEQEQKQERKKKQETGIRRRQQEQEQEKHNRRGKRERRRT
jgi:hypothetical protein